MKTLITIGLAAAFALPASAQYQPSTAPETFYGSLNGLKKVWNVGTDTRAEFSNPYGSTSVWFANFLNVTVTDHPGSSTPRFYWHGSHAVGTFGSLTLPADAYDPDVVLIENNVAIAALIVYYSASGGGYCMTWSLFNTGGTPNFGPLAAPVLVHSYTSPNDTLTCINIDADNDGNYAIAYQVGNQTYCKTGVLTPGATPVASVPGNTTVLNDWIQPDVSLQHSLSTPNMKVKIVGLRQNRAGYKVANRMLTPTTGPTITSSSYPAFSLNNPRIASPLDASTRFAVTMMQNNPGTSTYQILFDAYNGTTPIASRVLNTGMPGFPPSIASNVNRLPALSFVSDKIVVGWHTANLPGPPSAQNSTFVGLDLQDGSFVPTTPSQYLDICDTPDFNAPSAIAISGRYTIWGKSAAFEHYNVGKQSVAEQVWTIQNLGMVHWRPGQPEQQGIAETIAGFTLSPNPATDFLTLNAPRSDAQYRYFVFDLYGKKVSEGSIANGKALINVQSLANGTYFVRIAGGDTQAMNNMKFVKH
ncbi:T9SS type A sorting domain-containing protein [Taibaiella helva]|uniref:T9SS type A sorting domain-containing protein n=1 Tax=Taibaiella helva TaxID=2301235 RepID=UPI000E575DE5|nr:T9SS type A sorting domain-containing protein [Taibaiella helva]